MDYGSSEGFLDDDSKRSELIKSNYKISSSEDPQNKEGGGSNERKGLVFNQSLSLQES